MMKITWSITILSMSILSTACSHFQTKEAAYLDSVKGRGTQAEVRQELGAPQGGAAGGRRGNHMGLRADGATVREQVHGSRCLVRAIPPDL